MSVYRRPHKCTQAVALGKVKQEVVRSGYDKYVEWTGSKAEARVGPFATMVNVKGEVTDSEVVVEKSSGAFGGKALSEIKKLLETLFP